MEKQNTNFIEILLRKEMIGVTIYDHENNPILIEELNYDPKVKLVYIKSGDNSYKFRIDENYDFEFNSVLNEIVTNKIKITGKRFNYNELFNI